MALNCVVLKKIKIGFQYSNTNVKGTKNKVDVCTLSCLFILAVNNRAFYPVVNSRPVCVRYLGDGEFSLFPSNIL